MKKLLLIAMLLFIGCETPQEKNKNDIAVLKKELANLSNHMNNIPKNSQLILKIKYLEKAISKLSKDNKFLKEQINQLQKDINTIKNDQIKLSYIVIKPLTFVTAKNTKIYAKPEINSTIIRDINISNSFTSYKEKNGFLKVTGYFVDRKWKPNKKEWWIKKSDCIIKRVDK